MRILVTGGAGFLGSHLCDRLLDDGHNVVAADNYVTGSPRNLAHLSAHPNFVVLHHDVVDPLAIEVDAIYNLASPASPVHYQRDPVGTMRTNVVGSIMLLELAERLGIPIFQASTSEVYGDPEVHPQPESYWGRVNPTGPRACYDEGKRAAEAMFFDFHRRSGLAIRVARIFNTYGPRMGVDDGRVVTNFIVQALRGEPLTVYGDGSQTRSFCYVSDLVDGFVRLMTNDQGLIGPVNLGNPHEVTMVELAREILDLTDSSSELVFEPLPEDDPRQRQPDISLARSALGWEPRVALRQGLEATIADLAAATEIPVGR